MTRGLASDVREFVCRPSTCPRRAAPMAGNDGHRRDEIYAAYAVDEAIGTPTTQNILVIDDVLTAGAHFAAIQRRLRERFPTIGKILGGFYARRAVGVPTENG